MVDPWDPTPVYVQVADALAERIRSGQLPAGARLPGELSLASEFGVARETGRRAIRELRQRGLVVTLPARGTFVRPDTETAAPPE